MTASGAACWVAGRLRIRARRGRRWDDRAPGRASVPAWRCDAPGCGTKDRSSLFSVNGSKRAVVGGNSRRVGAADQNTLIKQSVSTETFPWPRYVRFFLFVVAAEPCAGAIGTFFSSMRLRGARKGCRCARTRCPVACVVFARAPVSRRWAGSRCAPNTLPSRQKRARPALQTTRRGPPLVRARALARLRAFSVSCPPRTEKSTGSGFFAHSHRGGIFTGLLSQGTGCATSPPLFRRGSEGRRPLPHQGEDRAVFAPLSKTDYLRRASVVQRLVHVCAFHDEHHARLHLAPFTVVEGVKPLASPWLTRSRARALPNVACRRACSITMASDVSWPHLAASWHGVAPLAWSTPWPPWRRRRLPPAARAAHRADHDARPAPLPCIRLGRTAR